MKEENINLIEAFEKQGHENSENNPQIAYFLFFIKFC